MRRGFGYLIVLGLALIATSAGAATFNVNVNNFSFTPATRSINVGDTIHWQLVAGFHTTTSGSPGNPNGIWAAPIDPDNTTYDRVFNTNGVFPYYCEIHGAAMTGTIVVGNQPPVVNNPGQRNGSEGSFFTVTVTATDLNGDALTMSSLGTTPAWATFVDNGNRSCTISGTPNFSQSGSYNVSVRATDPGGLSDTENFNISIANVNTAPVVTNPGTQNGTAGVFFTVTVSATDPQNDALTMSDLGTHPSWSTFTDNGNRSCTIQGTPPSGGTFPVSVRATDPGALSDTEGFNIVIASGNGPPVWTDPGNQSAEEGKSFLLVVSATDPQNDPLTLTGSGPAWLSIVDNGNRTANLSGVPPFGSAGSHPVTVYAQDTGGLRDTTNFNILVAPTGATVVNVQGSEAAGHTGHGSQEAGALPYGFLPPLVTIDEGDSVAWNWVEGSHTTTSGSSSDPSHNPGVLWDQTIDTANRIYFRRFTSPGVYDYFCRPHEGVGMKGRVIVRATTGVGDDVLGSVRGLRAFPNPFSASVELVFRLEESQEVGIEVYDLEGQRVRRLSAGSLPAGDHIVRWDGTDDAGRGAAAGVYLIRVQATQGTSVSKVFKTR